MSLRCPQGHESVATDYCDTCGSPLQAATPAAPVASASAAPATAAPAAPAAAPTQECPNCGVASLAEALFCEACGYDFTTGVMPRPVAMTDGSYVGGVAPADDGSEQAPGPEDSGAPDAAAADPQVAAGAGESPGPKPQPEPDVEPEAAVEPAPAESGKEPAQEPAPTSAPPPSSAPPPVPATPAPAALEDSEAPAAPAAPAGSFEAPPPPAEAAGTLGAPATPPGGTASKRMANRPPSRTTIKDWVVEIWIDPDWYAVQQSPEPCPSPGVPDVEALHDGALVGRPSSSRNIRPDVDCGADTGVSRRQALFTTDGRRWWIEDLDSSNGTYVGPASGPLPVDPITAKVEVDADDRIYVGAWTRLVVRPATDSERAGQG